MPASEQIGCTDSTQRRKPSARATQDGDIEVTAAQLIGQSEATEQPVCAIFSQVAEHEAETCAAEQLSPHVASGPSSLDWLDDAAPPHPIADKRTIEVAPQKMHVLIGRRPIRNGTPHRNWRRWSLRRFSTTRAQAMRERCEHDIGADRFVERRRRTNGGGGVWSRNHSGRVKTTRPKLRRARRISPSTSFAKLAGIEDAFRDAEPPRVPHHDMKVVPVGVP
jgi:hypothetical protein